MGAIAAAGVGAAMLSSEAEAQPRVRAGAELLRNLPLRYQRTDGGHVFSVQGPEIANVLAREGLAPRDQAGKADVGVFVMIGRRR